MSVQTGKIHARVSKDSFTGGSPVQLHHRRYRKSWDSSEIIHTSVDSSGANPARELTWNKIRKQNLAKELIYIYIKWTRTFADETCFRHHSQLHSSSLTFISLLFWCFESSEAVSSVRSHQKLTRKRKISNSLLSKSAAMADVKWHHLTAISLVNLPIERLRYWSHL